MDIIASTNVSTLESVDFGCNWIDGACAGMRKRTERGFKNIGYICCRQCVHNKGFLGIKTIPENYQSYWTDEHGFLEPNVGCKLPLSMRSYKCSTYVCRDAEISDENRQTLLQIESEHRNGNS